MAVQRFVRPLRQWMHSPHSGAKSVMTWSPGATSVTPSPTRSTTPAPSWPRTHGAYPLGSAPEAVYRSVWQTPHATSRTSTSSDFGSASSSSWTTRGSPNSSSTAARIFTSSAHRFLHERGDHLLVGGGQLRQREGGRPHAAVVDRRRLVEAERRVPLLELVRALEEAHDLAVLVGVRGHPVPGLRREIRCGGRDDRVNPLGHRAIRLRHLRDLLE